MSGEPMSGEPMSGEPMSGEPMIGEPMIGEPMIGEPMAGEPMAGESINEDCGLRSQASREIFAQVPLTLFAGSCTEQGCHTADSFREFKLSFVAPDNQDPFSPDQVTEGLDAVDEFVIIGQGSTSQISTRIIDDHASLLFNDQSSEYVSVVSWIDRLDPCD